MSKQAHTAGPWFASAEDGEVYSVSAYSSVAMVLMNENEANARLIAAAPEMLEALEAIIESGALDFATEQQSPPGYFDDLISQVRAALSKATGGE